MTLGMVMTLELVLAMEMAMEYTILTHIYHIRIMLPNIVFSRESHVIQ